MKTIIAGTDFSESSVNACKYAAFLADKLNCKLTIFNLFDAPLVHSNVGLYGITYTAQRTTSIYKTNKLIMVLQELYPKLKISSFVMTGGFKEELKKFVSQWLNTRLEQRARECINIEINAIDEIYAFAKSQLLKIAETLHNSNVY